MVVARVSSRALERWSRSWSGRVGRSSILRELELPTRNEVQTGAKFGLSEDSQVRALWRSSSCHQVRLSGLSPGGSWKFGPELASSRPIRPRSVCLGASAPIRLTRRVPESLLATISQSRRLHHVPRHHCEKGRDCLVLHFDQGLRGLFGSCDVLYLSPAAESSSASGSTTVSSGSRAYAGETSRQGGTVHAGTPQSTEHVGSQPTAGRGSTMRDADCDPGVLGMPSTRCTDSEAGRKEATVSPTSEPRSAWDVHHRHSAHLQDNSVWRKATPHRSPSAIRSALVPP
jgi:hypothetical protein